MPVRVSSRGMKRRTVLLGLSALVMLGGCGPSVYTANMANVSAKPPSFLVAAKIPSALYIVLDPALVRDEYSPKSERRKLTLNIKQFRQFVSRDLKGVMAQHFEKVEVVGPEYTFPAGQHVVANVKVDQLELKDQAVTGDVTVVSTRLFMTWSFAIRPSDAQDYLFSFAGVSASTNTSNGADDFVRQLVEDAITGLLQKWGEGDVSSKLRAWAKP